ncbi:MAG: PAS domain-containing sensor histidine kinase [Pseudomonadota bacterium]
MDKTINQYTDDIESLSAWQQAVLDSSEYGIISTDTKGVIATFNRTAEILLGYKAEEMIGIETPAIIHVPSEVEEYAELLSKELGKSIEPGFESFVAKTRLGLIDNREWHYVRKDGSTFPVYLSVTAIRNPEQEIIGFLGTFFDLSERKTSQSNLRKSEARYESLFDNASDAIILGGVDGKMAECNPAALKVFGCTQQQIVGQRIENFSPEYQPDGMLSSKKTEMLLGAALSGQSQFFEWTHQKFDGTPFDAEVSLKVVYIDNAPHFLGMVRDITDRKKADRERSLLFKELEIRNTEMERFTYTISHELKNPLVTIAGFAGMLEHDINEGVHEKLPAHIQQITNAADTMSALLNDLLELSRIGHITHQYEKVALSELIQVVIETIKLQIKGQDITFEIEPNIPEVWGDLSRLQEVIQNLIENAVKFSSSQPHSLIKVGAREQSNETIFYIEDNGIGIDPAYQNRVFELFERLNPSIEGTGVGLTLVQRIVESHGGQIWVESDGVGTGSTFCFTLPGHEEDMAQQ